jgi:hypothetical protein
MPQVVTLASREMDKEGEEEEEKQKEEQQEEKKDTRQDKLTIWEGSLGTGMPQVVTLAPCDGQNKKNEKKEEKKGKKKALNIRSAKDRWARGCPRW